MEEEGDSDAGDGEDIFELEGMSALEIAAHNSHPDLAGMAAGRAGGAQAVGWEGPARSAALNRSWGADGCQPSVDEASPPPSPILPSSSFIPPG